MAYHNITAKYNAYFIAREKLKEINTDIEEAHQNNFNKTLLVFPPLDTTLLNSNEEKLDDIIKKASIAIQRHKNSKWVDDSYILVGIARTYKQEFEEAVETFKYVNVNSKDDPTRHLALAHLIRTFTEYHEYNNAQAVIDYLNRQDLSKSDKEAIYRNMAHFYQVVEDPNNTIKYLNATVELMSTGPEKAKMNFILGQLFQQVGFDALAYDHYQKVLDNRPPYELFFYARLNMAQVTELGNGADIKKIRKYFTQLLKDGKNKEFRDKIYYEMAEFELKQGNIEEAIPFYKSSVQESINNPRQKSFSYRKLGLVYFEDLNEYELAKAYYDSAVSVMPKDEEIYEQVVSRQKILENFVTQITTIRENDSLLALAKMDSTSLDSMFLAIRAEKQALAEEEAKRKRREERNRATVTSLDRMGGNDTDILQPVATPNGEFYFYSNTTVASGRNEFQRIWGKRSLQDNWRTNEQTAIASNTSNPNNRPLDQKEEGQSLEANNQTANEPVTEEALMDQERNAFYDKIPFDKPTQIEMHQEIEEAYFALGNIYNFDLQEKKDAADTYETLINRYDTTSHKPEVLYLLNIYYKDKDSTKAKNYADELVNNFPNTIFAKLIVNPNYQEESNVASAKVKVIYEKAYLAYDSNNYKLALKLIDDGLTQYAENDYEDNLALLKALIIGINEGKSNYLYQLQEFIKNYPSSEMIDYAKELLQGIDNVEKAEQLREKIQYIKYFDQPHYFVVLYEQNKALANILPDQIDQFSERFYPDETLNAGNLVFDDEYSMILLSEFSNKKVAEDFYLKFNSDLSPLKNFSQMKFINFIISKDNFQIFYQAKVVDSYDTFFKENYNLAP